ncbi:uncharacterized protein [Rutidosis leptorrhynchoides]|uniref:uncharacterized protein n=1 Tax=Rutidosis leptorrhynchoides TaxID=125765 RepID=UPI003A999280
MSLSLCEVQEVLKINQGFSHSGVFMDKQKSITAFFKRTIDDTTKVDIQNSKRFKPSTSEHEQQQNEQVPPVFESSRPNVGDVDPNSFERDPGMREQIWSYPVDKREQVRRFYLNQGPYQIRLDEYPTKGTSTKPRRFRYAWFGKFSNWLEYSPTKDAAYCFLCYLFSDKPAVRKGDDAFIVKGFDKWKKVNDGNRCAFLKHANSLQHKSALLSSENLLNQAGHIENVFEKQRLESKLNNRLRLKASIDIVRWLTFQACAFRGHDESTNSSNRGNFLELLTLLASYNDDVAKVVLENAPYNSKFTSGLIQKELLNIIANKVRKHIRCEVGDSYFCVMVDESRDESKKEQMAIVLRFVDANGVLTERFLDLVHVQDTSAITLKRSLWERLSHYEFNTSKIRGQSYDGASNMRGEWNGLKALVLKDCPYAYYVHCFAHRLQLALVAASREVIPIHQGIIDDGSCSSQRGDADTAYGYTKSFEFVLILHLMKEILGKTEFLSQALQKKSQDIINAMTLVTATKEYLNDLRNNGWDSLLERVKIFSEKHEVDIPDLSAPYKSGRYRPRRQDNHQERNRLKSELELFNIELGKNPKLIGASTLTEVCRGLVETWKHENYNMLDRLIRLILTIPVSTATTERAFLGMKICKNRLRNKMSDEFLADNLVVYIEREIAEKFNSESVIDEFKMLKGRRAEL